MPLIEGFRYKLNPEGRKPQACSLAQEAPPRQQG